MNMKKRSGLEKIMPYVLSVGMLTFVAACGSDDDDDNDSTPVQQQQEQEVEGVYSADLQTLNAAVSGTSSGKANIAVVGDRMAITIKMNGVPMSMTHLQHIHTGSTCPTQAADTNGDSFVDVIEGVPTYGPILIPLDGDLRTQAGGASGSPRASSAGTYTYFKTVSLTDMLTDLGAPDEDTADATAKLAPGEELNLEGRHIVIHGVPASTLLPATVQSFVGAPPQATLPIACGVIVRDVTPDGASVP